MAAIFTCWRRSAELRTVDAEELVECGFERCGPWLWWRVPLDRGGL